MATKQARSTLETPEAIRAEAGLTPVQVEEAPNGVSQETLRKLEQGRHGVTTRTLRRLGALYETHGVAAATQRLVTAYMARCS